MLFDIVATKCPRCGQKHYGEDEEEVKEKYKKHICFDLLSDKELWDKIDVLVKVRKGR